MIESFFHFHPDVDLLPVGGSSFLCRLAGGGALRMEGKALEGASVRIAQGEQEAGMAGWHFPRYGEEQTAGTVIVKRRVELPFGQRLEIVPAD